MFLAAVIQGVTENNIYRIDKKELSLQKDIHSCRETNRNHVNCEEALGGLSEITIFLFKIFTMTIID